MQSDGNRKNAKTGFLCKRMRKSNQKRLSGKETSMNERVKKLLFALLRSAVCGAPFPDVGMETPDDETFSDLYELAKRHDLAHLIGYVLTEHSDFLKRENPYFENLEKQYMTAVFRYVQMNKEAERLCAALEDAKIPFVPLKGSVLRRYYPEPWMRPSCDIDILIERRHLGRATECLKDRLSYRPESTTSHDVSLYTPGGVHIELHYELIEDRWAKNSARVLKKIWRDVSPKDGYRYWNEMSDAMFYFYHIAHMAKHFENGGCGVRPLLDLWVLEHLVEHDNQERDALLSEGGLLTFANAIRQLSAVWFENAAHTGITPEMEQYILYGGVYGCTKTRIAVQQNKKGGKFRYILSRIILPYESIKHLYPVLQKHKWLTPICEVRRWLMVFRLHKAKRLVNEIRVNRNLCNRDVEITARMFKELEL